MSFQTRSNLGFFSFYHLVYFLQSCLLFSFLSLVGCSTAEKYDLETAEGLYKSGLELEKSERYDEAVLRFTDVKNKHPYSRFATEAELRIADVHFKKESFAEAQVAYQAFKDMHPKYERIDYVTFQVGMSYYNQLPTTTDRDISLTTNALVYFNEVLRSYPQSAFAKESEKRKRECFKMEAEKEFYIADFYFKRQKYESALGRLNGLLKNYPGSEWEKRALYRATVSSYELGEKDRAREYLERLKREHPQSEETRQAEGKIKR